MTSPKQASSFRIGDILMIYDEPYKLSKIDISKSSKHGVAKVHFTGFHVFTNKKTEYGCSSTDTLRTAELLKIEYVLNDILEENDDDTYLSLLSTNNTIREDFKLPENELGKKIYNIWNNNNTKDNNNIIIIVFKIDDKEQIMDMKMEN